MNASSVTQFSGFFADVIFVGCLAACLLYGAWAASGRKQLAGLGRLSLTLAFGGALALFVFSHQSAAALGPWSYLLFFVFLLLALFLLLEFLFQMSVLGLFVSVLGTAIAALHYMPLPATIPPTPPNSAVAYWWVLRDLALTTGAAVSALSLAAAWLLYFLRDRRSSPLVHPNDLRDVSALLAKGAVPCLFFGAFAAIGALTRTPAADWIDWGTTVGVVLWFGVSIAWWQEVERRRFSGRRMVALAALGLLALVAWGARVTGVLS